jgi:chromosomal replication initiation ATPase DnaA
MHRPAGFSPAGKRLYEAGLAFQRAERIRLAPPLPPPPAPIVVVRKESKKFQALVARVQAALDNMAGNDGRITLDNIISLVAIEFNTDPMLLKGVRRKIAYITPRHVACLLCTEFTSASLVQIGRAFGGRDHTTIIHAVRAINSKMVSDPELAEKVAGIRAKLNEAMA